MGNIRGSISAVGIMVLVSLLLLGGCATQQPTKQPANAPTDPGPALASVVTNANTAAAALPPVAASIRTRAGNIDAIASQVPDIAMAVTPQTDGLRSDAGQLDDQSKKISALASEVALLKQQVADQTSEVVRARANEKIALAAAEVANKRADKSDAEAKAATDALEHLKSEAVKDKFVLSAFWAGLAGICLFVAGIWPLKNMWVSGIGGACMVVSAVIYIWIRCLEWFDAHLGIIVLSTVSAIAIGVVIYLWRKHWNLKAAYSDLLDFFDRNQTTIKAVATAIEAQPDAVSKQIKASIGQVAKAAGVENIVKETITEVKSEIDPQDIADASKPIVVQ